MKRLRLDSLNLKKVQFIIPEETRRVLAWRGYQELRSRGVKFFVNYTKETVEIQVTAHEHNQPPHDYWQRALKFVENYFDYIIGFLERERRAGVSIEATHNIDIDIDEKYSEPQFSAYAHGWREVCINCVNLKANERGWFCGKTKRALSSERVFRKKTHCNHVCIRFEGDERKFFPPAPRVITFKPFTSEDGDHAART